MESSQIFSGFENLGNTCYIASSLQCFLHIPKIFTYFSDSLHKKDLKNEFLSSLSQLFFEILADNFKRASFELFLKNFDEFCDGSQQDAQEFLKLFLEKIHVISNRGDANFVIKPLKYQSNKDDNVQKKLCWDFLRKRDNSIITELFCGQLASSLTCDYCKNTTKKFEDFWDISLSFRDFSAKFDKYNRKEVYNLSEMFENFFTNETIENRKCDKCSENKKAIKSLEISRFPNVLILHIKRFYYKENRREKLNYFVRFPIKGGFFKNSKKNNMNCGYNLIGIIHHLGGLENGHYYAECRDPRSGVWAQYDDEEVGVVEKDEEECMKKGSDSAYILFYVKNKGF